MNSIADFLKKLEELDIRIWAEGDRLRYNAPENAMKPEIMGRLRADKERLIAFLQGKAGKGRDALPMSFSQERLWFLHRLEPDNLFYNLFWGFSLEGELDSDLLADCFKTIIRRHEVLRTTFAETEKGDAVQIVGELRDFEIPVTDLQGLSDEKAARIIKETARTESLTPFDPSSGPLLRVRLARLAPDSHLLFLTIHHMVSDGWSMDIMVRELAAAYSAGKKGLAPLLPPLSIQYADFAARQRKWRKSPEWEARAKFWKENLAGAPAVLELPFDHPRPSRLTFNGASFPMSAEKDIQDRIRELNHKTGTTPFMVLFAVFATLLHRYGGQEDILIGTPAANRNMEETESLIGFFVNTLVLRTIFSDRMTFSDLLKRVRETAISAYDNQDLPFEQLVEILRPERSLSHTPLFQVMFSYSNIISEPVELPGLKIKALEWETHTAQFDLTMEWIEEWIESGEGLKGRMVYNTDLFEGETIRRMAGHFNVLLDAALSSPRTLVQELPMMTDSEMQEIIHGRNRTLFPYPADKTIARCFEENAALFPERNAVIHVPDSGEPVYLSYGELNREANRIAHYLKNEYGIKPDDRIGFFIERSERILTGILGILKSGGAYVPVDPEFPKHRIRYILENSGCRVILTEPEFFSYFEGLPDTAVCNIDEIKGETGNPLNGAGPENLAYVMYTSGSTGNPKGVMITHKNVVGFQADMTPRFGITEKDRIYALTTVTFDISVLELINGVLTGASVCISPDAELKDPEKILDALNSRKITVLQVTPSRLKLLLEGKNPEVLSMLNVLLIGGEPLPRDLFEKLKPLFSRVRVVNVYGPTEATIWSTCRHLTDGELNIGTPLLNETVYILTEKGAPVPVGTVGEICIGGNGLARGYFRQPELTEEKFVPHPFIAGERIYRTGDLGKLLPDGNIECLGRNDNQVKVRGYRIELGEIENALRDHESVREAAVIVRPSGGGENELYAYVMGSGKMEIPALREHLESRLPGYMIPSVFIPMERMPLTPNGKIDRKALPIPDAADRRSGNEYVPPKDEVEKGLVKIWKEILETDTVGIADNFFEMGGHSLKTTRMLNLIRKELGADIPLQDIFARPTIAELAKVIRKQSGESTRLSTPSLRSLIRIQASGKKIPMFFMHTGLGDVSCYNVLSRELGPDQPFFGLESVEHSESEAEKAEVKDMAAAYVEAIRTFYPDGPYIIGGYSFGGVIAYETARQLKSAGAEVPLLIFIDAFAVPEQPGKTMDELWMDFFMAFDGSENPFFHSLYRTVRGLPEDAGIQAIREDFRSLDETERLKILWEGARKAGYLPPDFSHKDQKRIMKHQLEISQAFFRYRVEPYDGPILAFSSDDDPRIKNPDTETIVDWSLYAKVESRHFPGSDHLTIIQPPHVEKLAGIIDEYLFRG